MAQQPDALRSDQAQQDPADLQREIARTRAEMGMTVEAIEDRVSPRRIRARQAERLRTSFRGVREAVMGSPDSPSRSRGAEAADRTRQVAQQLPEGASHLTRGNPLAAGIIAFGAGALVGTVTPTTGVERQMGTRVRDALEEPVGQRLEDAGRQLTETLKEQSREAGHEVKETAQDASHRVRDSMGGSSTT